jgi:hypothetical protein
VLVTHFLKIVGDQRGAITATAIEENLRLPVRDLAFDVALDDSLAKVYCPGDVPGSPFMILADVDETKIFFRIQPFLQLWDSGLADTLFRVPDERQKCGGMLFCHGIVLLLFYPIRQENINLMRLPGVAVGCENHPLAIRRELREDIEAGSEVEPLRQWWARCTGNPFCHLHVKVKGQ